MKRFNFITLLIALFMMNIMHAELKTWGMPSDAETEEVPSNETPSEETPSEKTPIEEIPTIFPSHTRCRQIRLKLFGTQTRT